jgi:carboxymethylenebutenolidase
MAMTDVEVPTQDGVAGASLHVPEGSGPWPAVIMYPDAGGTRAVFRDMGDRLAADGFAVLVPDVYSRAGGYEPFSMDTVFTDADERARLGTLMGTLTVARVQDDATAFADFLAGRPEVTSGPIGTTGYCMGGRLSLLVAGQLGPRIGAAASFHGGRLAVADDPDSPHQLAADVRAVVYVGAAANDPSFDEDQATRLHEAYDAAGISYTIDEYPAAHGFAVPDNPTYDEAAYERHWSAMSALFGSALR